MKHINNSSFELFYTNHNDNHNDNDNHHMINIDINKEIYRGELYCSLLKNFTKSCLTNLNEDVFSHKKNYTRTITNLLASWFFTLYQQCDFKLDPFFPSDYKNNNDIIKRILIDYCSLYKIENIDTKINNIIGDLYVSYEILLNKLAEYKKNTIINNINNINIYKTETTCDRNNKNILFYNFHISNNTNKICNKLTNIINNIMIPVEQYNEMKNRFKYSTDQIEYQIEYQIDNPINDFMDKIIWIILFRYQLLSSNNNQLAVIPKVYNKMITDFGLSVECFASAINTSLDYFCSIYYDVEKYFGSLGNFFNIIPKKGVYSFNPPYQFDVISNGILKIINHMESTQEKLAFIITIPIWDNEGKQIMLDNNMENNNNIIKYNEFEIMNTIKKSPYFRGLRMISKDNFTYMDHNFYLFKNKTIQNTYVIVMSNYENDYIENINKINFYE
jgi:hypothetical protein